MCHHQSKKIKKLSRQFSFFYFVGLFFLHYCHYWSIVFQLLLADTMWARLLSDPLSCYDSGSLSLHLCTASLQLHHHGLRRVRPVSAHALDEPAGIQQVFTRSHYYYHSVRCAVAGADLLWKKSNIGWLKTADWCWFNMREKYCWLDAANRVDSALPGVQCFRTEKSTNYCTFEPAW